MQYSTEFFKLPYLFMVNKIMHFNGLVTPAAGLYNPPRAVPPLSHDYLLLEMSTCNFPTQLSPFCTKLCPHPSKNLKTKLFLKAVECICWVWAHCTSVLRTEDFFSLWGQYSPCHLLGSMSCFLPTSSEAAGDKQSNTLCWRREVLSFKISTFLPKLPTLVQWTAISWSHGHQTSSHGGLRWQTGQKQAQVILTTRKPTPRVGPTIGQSLSLECTGVHLSQGSSVTL